MSDHQQPQYGNQYGNDAPKGPYDAPYSSPGERRGMSGCAKAFLIIGGLGVVALLVCCVGGWVYMRSIVKTEPAEVLEIGDQIVDWDYSRELSPQFGFNMFEYVRMATFSDPEKGMVMVIDTKFADAEAMSREIDKQMKGQVQSGDEMLEATEMIEPGEREVEIRGSTYKLKFDKTRGKNSGKEYWEVFGVVPGKKFGAFVNMKLRSDTYDEETILERFRNLK